MDEESQRLADRSRSKGLKTIFDANVAYYSRKGREYFRDMIPSAAQQRNAISMTSLADAVIADSTFIEKHCRRLNNVVARITDSVRTDLVPHYKPYAYSTGKLRLLWSGQVTKLVDLLAIEDSLRRYARWINLVIVTNGLEAMDLIFEPYRSRLRSLLDFMDVELISYQDPVHLFDVYRQGGALISPRFLDSDYNMGHTEWKITLGLACGRVALCSPVPSYVEVADRAEGGIRICDAVPQWDAALDEILGRGFNFEYEEASARNVVARYYATEVVAEQHSRFLSDVFRV